MTEYARNIIVGVSTIFALLGLAALLMLFGELDVVFKDRYAVSIDLNSAGGLRPGSMVELNGVPIGVIETVQLQPKPRTPVEAVAMIDQHVAIPDHARPQILAPLIGGSAVLRLEAEPRDEQHVAYLPRDDSARLEGRYERPVEVVIRQLDERLEPLLASLRKVEEVSNTYIELGRNLNELVRPDDDLAEIRNLRTAVETLNTVFDEGRETLALAREWLGDEQLRHDAHLAVENANILIEDSAEAMRGVTSIAKRVETDVDLLINRLMPLADELDTTLREVRGVVRKVDDGDGTVGRLINDPDLYQSLDDAAYRLERMLVEVQLLVERIRNEGVPIDLWGRGRSR